MQTTFLANRLGFLWSISFWITEWKCAICKQNCRLTAFQNFTYQSQFLSLIMQLSPQFISFIVQTVQIVVCSCLAHYISYNPTQLWLFSSFSSQNKDHIANSRFIWATKSKPKNLLKTETPLIHAHTPQTQNTVFLSPSRSPYMLHTFPDLKHKKSTSSVQRSLLFKTQIFCLSLNVSSCLISPSWCFITVLLQGFRCYFLHHCCWVISLMLRFQVIQVAWL